jgi:hypothetical protein
MEKLNDLLILQHELVKEKEKVKGLEYEVEYWKEQAAKK